MILIIKILGVILIALAVIIVVRPQTIKQLMGHMLEGNLCYFAGIMRIVLGVFLLIAAAQCKYPAVIIALGIISLASGILLFIIGIERVKTIIRTVAEKGELVHRLIAIIPLAVGILLVYAA